MLVQRLSSQVALVAQHYQIRHVALAIDDPGRLLGTLADKLLGVFRQPNPPHELAAGRLRLEVHSEGGRAVHRESLPRVWRGSVEGVDYAIFRYGGRRRLELPNLAVLDFDLSAGWAFLCVPPAADDAAISHLLLTFVCDSLTRGGHSFIHAACLAIPRRGEWRGVVLSAASKTDKTTTALALADNGWRLLGDDATYVRPPHQGSGVWAFPRPCHVRPASIELLPWLSQLQLGAADTDGVRSVPLSHLGERTWVDAPWLPPSLIVVLDPPNRRDTRIEAIDRADVLSRLGSESINAAQGIQGDEAARDFVTLGRLVCAAPACRLSVGPQIVDVARRLEQFLDAHEVPSHGRQATSRRIAA